MVEKTAEAEQVSQVMHMKFLLKESTTQQSSDHVSSEHESTEVEALISDTESVGETEATPTETPKEPSSFDEADLAKAEEYKTKGNEFFKMNKF